MTEEGDPRNNADDAQRAFESMDQEAWDLMWESPGMPHGLTRAEQEGLSRAIVTRIRRKQEGRALDTLFERADEAARDAASE